MMIQNLDDLFFQALKDVLNKMRKLPNVGRGLHKRATGPSLKTAFAMRRDETEGPLALLDAAFESPCKWVARACPQGQTAAATAP